MDYSKLLGKIQNIAAIYNPVEHPARQNPPDHRPDYKEIACAMRDATDTLFNEVEEAEEAERGPIQCGVCRIDFATEKEYQAHIPECY